MKNVYSIAILMAFSFLFYASAVQKPEKEPVKKTFTFDYKLLTPEKSGSAGMVLAFVKPNYGSKFKYSESELFKRLRASMADDVEELILDKGFTIQNDEPFESIDDMVFDQKKSTDIVIKIELSPEFDNAIGEWHSSYNVWTKAYSYQYIGLVTLIGKINLSGIEPLSGQKIWSKSVTIPTISQIPIKTELKYNSSNVSESTLYDDPGIYNAIGAAFAQQYKSVMDKIAGHFNPQELRTLKAQIKELKTKKVY